MRQMRPRVAPFRGTMREDAATHRDDETVRTRVSPWSGTTEEWAAAHRRPRDCPAARGDMKMSAAPRNAAPWNAATGKARPHVNECGRMLRGTKERGDTETARPRVDGCGSMLRGTIRGGMERGTMQMIAAACNAAPNAQRQRVTRHHTRQHARCNTQILRASTCALQRGARNHRARKHGEACGSTSQRANVMRGTMGVVPYAWQHSST